MRDRPKDLARSVRDRLKTIAAAQRLDYNLVLTRYVLERLLFRLGASPHGSRFALKGAMLFAVWTEDIIRPTRDLDLLGLGDPDVAQMRLTFVEILSIDTADDGVAFDLDSVDAQRIRADQVYEGIRVTARGLVGSARVPIRVDIGFGDAVTPGLRDETYPTLLDGPAPRLKAYARETVIAEKLEALVAIGARTSRMKDVYDLYCLPRLFDFDGPVLTDAVRATFARRRTPLPDRTPPALSGLMVADPMARSRWSAFVGRTSLLVTPPPFDAIVSEVTAFAMPVMKAARGAAAPPAWWSPHDGWRADLP